MAVQSASGSEEKQQQQQQQQAEKEEIQKDVQITKDNTGRRIGRWFIGETLGKGGYSWVKKGIDRKNGRIVALKFMARRLDKDGNWKKSQQSQIKNEIETLKCLRHEHIIRLLAYNLNAKYPDGTEKTRDVILLVLEYAAGGELFDILYYTEKLEPILARTYFRQLVSGISFMHDNGIIHRDIKPQNLLLDHKYNLKITDFGLSKIDPTGNSNVKMNEWHVGTRGYQAPEILLRKKDYDKKVDIFAMGVVLFILLGGYPPFEHARENDKWYGFIVHKKYKNFWKSHRNCGLRQQETDLITRMICFDPEKRISMEKIQKHPWFTSKEILSQENIIKVLRYRHQKMEQLRNTDPHKQQILQNSEARRPLQPALLAEIAKRGKKETDLPPILPEEEIINPHDVYTAPQINPYEVLQTLEMCITDDLNGVLIKPDYNEVGEFTDAGVVNTDDMKVTDSNDPNFGGVYIDVANFSLLFQTAIQDLDDEQINAEHVFVLVCIYRVQVGKNKDDEPLYNNLVKFVRVSGERGAFAKTIKMLSEKAGSVLAGVDKNVAKSIEPYMMQQLKQDGNKFDGFKSFDEMYKACFPDKPGTNADAQEAQYQET